MSQLSFSSFNASLMVRDAQGRYLSATADQNLEAARRAIEHKMQRGASFSSPAAVKEYVHTEDDPVRKAAELVASRRKSVVSTRQEPKEVTT